MNSSKLDRNKDTGSLIQKYTKSFKHSIDGIVYAIENEINILFMMLGTILVLLLSYFLKISAIELCFVVISTGVLMACELLNSAIEATVDLITLETHPLAKISKDCGSGATCIVLFAYFFVLGIIFVPKIIELF